ncbi:MAG: FumA C-terminus/TtdB family hydratase beta subunit [Endomicrobium sp.]|jgi:fumarate hydratase subunit beta|nr:FumA C-terminus/TtdB family hydratase beta subunit [Endomicrobium sp.]
MRVILQDLLLDSKTIKAGQKILLSGTVYTARDVAHKKIIDILDSNGELPFNLKNSAIYYCGPTPSKPGSVIGVCGPTTSARMDIFTQRILKEGVKFFIGKGSRSKTIANSIKEAGAIYFSATGGVAALLSKTVKTADVVAFEDIGPEAVYKIEIEDMPLIVAIDSFGGNIFNF